MHAFRLRLILALIASVICVSVASSFFEVLTRKHTLREQLIQQSKWMGLSLEQQLVQELLTGDQDGVASSLDAAKNRGDLLGVEVTDGAGKQLTATGSAEVLHALTPGLVEKSLRNGDEESAFSHNQDANWLESVFPLHNGNQLVGGLVLVSDAGYIRAESNSVWKQSFLRTVLLVLIITGITFAMVRWFLMRPLLRVADRLRRVRAGDAPAAIESDELAMFTPLAREVETLAGSLVAARAAAEAEARLRAAGESLWTAERLAVHMQSWAGTNSIFVVSNREPYMHFRDGRDIKWKVPPSGLVTALEPVLRACDGVWVASGSGDADREVVDEFDRLRVPPDDPRYTLRRVWLTEDEETHYYEGFSNEGLWPLCHIAHTRPIFRPADWESYQRVNERFATALLEEMEDCEHPLVFVQDYHFALLPRLVKAARPDARVAIFWHIPWPNAEAFGICPWQSEILDGLLGADLIGFHIPMHCSNFLDTVDRVFEARTDRAHMNVSRGGHITAVRSYPISVAFDGAPTESSIAGASITRADLRTQLLSEFGVEAQSIAVGVDRLDYTKGIVERLLALEHLIEERSWHWDKLTLVQIAAPSRTRIPAYDELHKRVNEEVARINQRYGTARWRPIVLVERQCSHAEVARWYRAADLCLVTSLHDGMNLVAKEFVAEREDEDGVLILSKFAGAAAELRDALIVNPYDIAGVAEAMHAGLMMDREERRVRMQRMRRQVMEHNIYRWASSVLGALREIRLEETLSPELAAATVVSEAPRQRRRKLAS